MPTIDDICTNVRLRLGDCQRLRSGVVSARSTDHPLSSLIPRVF